MPRKAKKWRAKLKPSPQKKKKAIEVVGDVTIDDFANNTAAISRAKKAVDNVFCKVKEVLSTKDHNDNDDDDTILSASDSEIMDVDGANHELHNGKEAQQIKEDLGVEYPFDVWFLISAFVKPEDVSVFARICKTTYYVTKTAKFWFHMYKWFYKPIAGVPRYLKPENMVHPYGLRAYVIRALHFTYFPLFKGPANMFHAQYKDPHSLVHRRCILMWHKNDEDRCYFFFKLEQNSSKLSSQRFRVQKNGNLDFVSSADVAYNPENNCKILKVTTLKYSMVQPVIGLTLQSVAVQLSRGYSHYKVQLGFGMSYTPKTPSQIAVLSEVIHIDILDWWQQRYPYQEIERTIHLPPTTDCWDQI